MLMNISKSTYINWRQLCIPRRDVLTSDHGLSGYTSNAAKPEVLHSIKKFVMSTVVSDGHPLPVRIRKRGRHFIDNVECDGAVVLPRRYTKRSLNMMYCKSNTNEDVMLSCTTFVDVLEQELPFIRVSLRARSLCDFCFACRDSVRTITDKHLIEKANELRAHLNCADATRDAYRSSQLKSRTILRTVVSNRIQYAAISYGYAKQLTVPMLSEQTMHEWFAQKRGYEVNLFGIVDENSANNGHQYNMEY